MLIITGIAKLLIIRDNNIWKEQIETPPINPHKSQLISSCGMGAEIPQIFPDIKNNISCQSKVSPKSEEAVISFLITIL